MIAELKRLAEDHSTPTIEKVLSQIVNSHARDIRVGRDLAKILAGSGKTLAADGKETVDVASTGSPTSLSTLLSPLYLRAVGLHVPKLGVPGRPAGGIDCLAQIPGFRVNLSAEEASGLYKKTGFVHFVADGEFAPLDRKIFSVRQKIGAQAIPTLVAASLLAKKIALGVRTVGLDVRVVKYGNFGATWEEAERNASYFISVANELDITAAPVLTDAEFPYQPFLGRSESLIAMHSIFEGWTNAWLEEHVELCHRLAVQTSPKTLRSSVASVNRQELQDVFFKNLSSQGASPESFVELVNRSKANHKLKILASKSGFLSIDLEGLRTLIVNTQKRLSCGSLEFPDPLGLVFLERPGRWVEKDMPIATLRSEIGDRDNIVTKIEQLVTTVPTSIGPLFKSVI